MTATDRSESGADAEKSPLFKIQHRNANAVWEDVQTDDGELLLFSTFDLAQAEARRRYPIETKLASYSSGVKTWRIINVNAYSDKDD